MADDTTRIINLTEATEVSDGMYLVTDASTGTKKLSIQKVFNKAGEIVADAYSSSSTYAVGDLCVYNGALYECNTAITTAEAWNSAHWTLTKAGDEITDLKSAIDYIADVETMQKTFSGFNYTEGNISVVSGAFVSSNGIYVDKTFYDISDYDRLSFNTGIGFEVTVYFYSTASEASYVTFIQSASGELNIEDNYKYFRVRTAKPNNTETEQEAIGANTTIITAQSYPLLNVRINDTDFCNVKYNYSLTNEYVKNSDGSVNTLTAALLSDYVPVETGDIVVYDAHNVSGVANLISCYDSSKNYIKSLSIMATGGSAGGWIENSGTFTIPNSVAYIRVGYKVDNQREDYFVIYKNNLLMPSQFVSEKWDGEQWADKKWCAFGTSITATHNIDEHFLQRTGKYIPYLEELIKIPAVNYGIPGGSFMTDILNRVLAVDLSNFDLVTIEGAINDFATSKPLGEVGDNTNSTFAGCIYLMAQYICSNSNATLIFITDHVGRNVESMVAPDGTTYSANMAPERENSLGLKQIDYIKMIQNVCEYLEIPCIMAGQNSGINPFTGDLYLMDALHQSYIGGKQYANTIWEFLKEIPPRVISLT